MMRIMLAVLIATLLSPFCLSQKCDIGMVGGAEPAIDVLGRLSPDDTDAESRQCIDAAISMVSQVRSTDAISELIRYLSFKSERDKNPEEVEGIVGYTHRYGEGSEYPAVVALARIGSAARPALLQVIESEGSSLIVAQNAAHAIVLSFTHEEDQDPGKGILLLRNAEKSASDQTKQKLERAVAFILTTRSCKRFATKCQDADRKSSAK